MAGVFTNTKHMTIDELETTIKDMQQTLADLERVPESIPVAIKERQ